MADKRISQLIERTDIANNDVLPIVASGATTTNKVTISTIQDWMQDNLDVGVTSVGITFGTSGTDINASGSPVTSSGNITINLPTASATNRGALSSADWITFNSKQPAGNYVTLDTAQTITAQKTFTTSGSSDTMIISHGSGSGFALDVIKAGNNEAIRVTKTSGSGNAMTVIGGNFEAPTIVKTGGTSSEFLKADGSVDSNSYVTLNTTQTISGTKTFTTLNYTTFTNNDFFQAEFSNGSSKLNLGSASNIGHIASNGDLRFNTNYPTDALGSPKLTIASNGQATFSVDAVINGVNVGRGGGNAVENTRLGNSALSVNTTGTGNTAAGSFALSKNTTGGGNTAVGTQTLQENTTGEGNTAVGQFSLIDNTTGLRNSALGYLSLSDNTTGIDNVGIGFFSLFTNTTGSDNTALGHNSGSYIADGSTTNSITNNSIYIGSDTKALANNQTNQIVIGHNATGNGSNTVTIGNSSITNNYFTGNIRGGAFIKTSGTSSEFLMADGSVNTSVLPSGAYLPLAGGTLTGGLGGTSASFSSDVQTSTRLIAAKPAGEIRITPDLSGTTNRIESLGSLPFSLTSVGAITLAAGGTTPQITLATGGAVTLSNLAGTGTRMVVADSNGVLSTAANPVTGTGTNNFVPKFTSSLGTIGNSTIQDSGSQITLGNPTNVTGALNGTSASFISTIANPLHVETSGADGGIQIYRNVNSDGGSAALFMSHKSTAGVINTANIEVVGSGSMLFRTGATGLGNFGTTRLIISSTGAATFSSTINAAKGTFVSNDEALKIQSADTNGAYLTISPSTGSDIGYIGSNFHLTSGGAATDLAIRATANMIFDAGGATERMRITSGGFLKASNDGSYIGGNIHEFLADTANSYTLIVSNKSASPASTYIQDFRFTASTPNNSSARFWNCEDATANRAYMRSDGGLANYATNNVILSDERVKKDIEPLESYWDKFKAIEIVKYKYIDQTHDDFNIGVIAQQVESIAPEFVDIDGWDNRPKLDEEGNEIVSEEEPIKSIYASDLHHATIKVLQEAMAKIEKLEEEISSLKNQMQ